MTKIAGMQVAESPQTMASTQTRSLPNRSGKVVHVIGALAAGGAERFVVNLISALADQGLDVELWVMSNRCEAVTAPFLERLKQSNIEVATGPTGKVGPMTIAWYANRLWKDGPAVIHLHTPNTELLHALAAAFAGWRGRKFRTLHNMAIPVKYFQRYVFLNACYEMSVACGRSVFEKFSDRFKNNIVEIGNGVEFNWPMQTQHGRTEARSDVGLGHGKRIFLCIGRMDGANPAESQKGHDILVDAWKRSGLGRAIGELHFLGDGPLKLELERMAGKDDGIFFHGIQPYPHRWLLAADIFVMPSRWEGLPIAGIEGIGTGLPCVLSSIDTLRELNPPVAFWFTPDDVVGLAAALICANQSIAAPAITAIEDFRRRFSIQNCAKRYADLYDQGYVKKFS